MRHRGKHLLGAAVFILGWSTVGNATTYNFSWSGDPASDSTIVSSDDAALSATGTIVINADPGSTFTIADITATNITVTGTPGNFTPFTFTSWNMPSGTISADGLSATFDAAGHLSSASTSTNFFGCLLFECGLGGSQVDFDISVFNPGFTFDEDVVYQSADDAAASMHMTAATTATPLPATLPLFTTGIGGLGLLGWRRKRKARTVA